LVLRRIGYLVCFAGLLLLVGCRHKIAPPMKIGMWYWNTPFTISPHDGEVLDRIGVSTLYVRSGTFTTNGKRLLTSVPQTWGHQAGHQKVVLTFNFDGGLRSHIEELSNAVMAEDIVRGIDRIRRKALSHGIPVSGVQMDVDCPTRLLPKYAQLLTQIRKGLTRLGDMGPGQTFSATSLQTWLTSRRYQDLADAVDFVAPQFYEGQIGRTIERIRPIADADNLVPGMNRADSAGKPFFAGIGIYGHSLLFDERGKLLGTYHGLRPEDAIRHPSLETENEIPLDSAGNRASEKQFIGENLVILKAVRPDEQGKGQGFRIAYWVPGAEMLRRQLEIVRDSRPGNCQGVILYRFPEEKDVLSLPLATVEAAVFNQPLKPKLEVKATRHGSPYGLIDSDLKATTPPYDYKITVKSTGNIPTDVSSHALGVLVRFSGPGIDIAERGDFDGLLPGMVNPDGQFQPCALAHANALILKSAYLAPGSQLKAGTIQTKPDGPKLEKIEYYGKFDGGFKPYKESMVPTF